VPQEGWAQPDALESLRNRFVTGDWAEAEARQAEGEAAVDTEEGDEDAAAEELEREFPGYAPPRFAGKPVVPLRPGP
jgi:hypothetical protein